MVTRASSRNTLPFCLRHCTRLPMRLQPLTQVPTFPTQGEPDANLGCRSQGPAPNPSTLGWLSIHASLALGGPGPGSQACQFHPSADGAWICTSSPNIALEDQAYISAISTWWPNRHHIKAKSFTSQLKACSSLPHLSHWPIHASTSQGQP